MFKEDKYTQISIFDIKPIQRNKGSPLKKIEYRNITLDQLKTYKKLLNTKKVRRIINGCSGNVCIEVIEKTNKLVTYYINKRGEIEFKFNGLSCVLPRDKIIYYADINYFKLNKIQTARLKECIRSGRRNIQRIIKRNGDFNILIEHKDGKVSSITTKGWVLEFFNVKNIDCKENEILNL